MAEKLCELKKKGGNGGGTLDLPDMPTSSTPIILNRGQQSASTGKCCKVNTQTATLHAKAQNSNIVLQFSYLKNDGTASGGTLSLTSSNTWYSSNLNLEGVGAMAFFYTGSLTQGNTVTVYFD